MKIELKRVSVRAIVNGYENNKEEGVIGYGGKLNIRPKYQREFIYKEKQAVAVVDTIKKNFPLNVLYWVENEDGTFEVLDGQQRIMSICEYVVDGFSREFQFFHNLSKEEQDELLDYEMMVYFCTGTDSEKIDWFKTINIAGEKLTNQELRNAIYTGKWLTEAKKHFSKPDCPAFDIGKKYLKGSPIRQDYLETVIKWISNDHVGQYMSTHQQKSNANELWLYYQAVLNWIGAVFPTYRREMKGVQYGFLYNEFKDTEFDPDTIEREVLNLMKDEDVTKKSGIYSYILTGNEKHLNVRSFSKNQKRETYENQKGICAKCEGEFELSEMEADHITPWHEGGKTILENCQMLCRKCNRTKAGK